MKLQNYISVFSSNLYVKKERDVYKIMDSYNEKVWISFKKVEKISPVLLIPDIYFEGLIDFLLTDDLPNHYKIKDDVLAKIEKEVNKKEFDNFDLICKESLVNEGFIDWHDVCKVLRGEEKIIIKKRIINFK